MSTDIVLCKRCKHKVVNAVKCVECSHSYHLSCAKLNNNVEVIDETLFKCCANELNNDSEENVILSEALIAMTDSNNKIDARIVQYLITQKDLIIKKLHDKLDFLNRHVDLLTEYNARVSNSTKSTQAINDDTCPTSCASLTIDDSILDKPNGVNKCSNANEP
ncbi:hypothetical protein C0J52_17469 [Blattella germanica]|nr:hypothetical protein C0J52_17469 [Blattella germanica]